jgi:predicted dehydrogenase
MGIAFIGCGFAADFYAVTLRNYPQLSLVGVFDQDGRRAADFARAHAVEQYASLAELLQAGDVDLVVNLTNPEEHHHLTKACLEAGKHVYSEKPLAMTFPEAAGLVRLANERGLGLSCAPCNALGEAAQTVWRLLREGAIGEVYLAYAELDSGAVHQMDYRSWLNRLGAPWPAADEFATGCTMEHAAYYLTWLTMFFGPARQVTAFAACLAPRKSFGSDAAATGDDFSVGCIRFASGAVARLTCSTLVTRNHSLTIVGSEGVITVDDCWDYESPVYLQRRLPPPRWPDAAHLSGRRAVPLDRPAGERVRYILGHDMDFARGVADLADAVAEGRSPRLSAAHSLHVLDIILAITSADAYPRQITTSFPPMSPMPWANGGQTRPANSEADEGDLSPAGPPAPPGLADEERRRAEDLQNAYARLEEAYRAQAAWAADLERRLKLCEGKTGPIARFSRIWRR